MRGQSRGHRCEGSHGRQPRAGAIALGNGARAVTDGTVHPCDAGPVADGTQCEPTHGGHSVWCGASQGGHLVRGRPRPRPRVAPASMARQGATPDTASAAQGVGIINPSRECRMRRMLADSIRAGGWCVLREDEAVLASDLMRQWDLGSAAVGPGRTRATAGDPDRRFRAAGPSAGRGPGNGREDPRRPPRGCRSPLPGQGGPRLGQVGTWFATRRGGSRSRPRARPVCRRIRQRPARLNGPSRRAGPRCPPLDARPATVPEAAETA